MLDIESAGAIVAVADDGSNLESGIVPRDVGDQVPGGEKFSGESAHQRFVLRERRFSRENSPSVSFHFQMGGVIQPGHRSEGLDELRASRAERTDSLRVDGDVKVDPPGIGLLPILIGGVGKIGSEIDEAEDVSIGFSPHRLMEIARLGIGSEGASPCPIAGGMIELNGAGDVEFVEANGGLVETPDRGFDVFKFNGLMADVVADSDEFAKEVGSFRILRGVEEMAEEIERFGSGFQEAKRLWFDGQSDGFSGVLPKSIQEFGQVDQVPNRDL